MRSIKKGLVYVFIANLINLIFNIIMNFALPHFLSIDSYAIIKTYQLYIGYAGLFHLGFIDGMYLKYGGKEINEIDSNDLIKNLSTLRLFQTLLILIIIFVSVFLHARVLFFFAISVLPLNMMSYFKQLYQATGEFSLYGKVINMSTILVFAFNTFLLVLEIDNGYYYLISSCLVYIFVWLFLEIRIKKKLIGFRSPIFIFSISEFIENIKAGILLTIGNLSSTFLTGMDRWFIKALMDTNAFAQYSFAVSMEGFMNVAVTPVTITLYNYFCKEKEVEKIVKVRNCIMIFASTIVSCAFPAVFILDVYLTKYKNAANVLYILFSAQIFYIIIKAIYVNLYKAQKRQGIYFYKLIIVIVIGFVLNAFCYWFMRSKESFAIGTLLASIVWFVLSLIDFKNVKYSYKEIIYPFSQVIVFLFFGNCFNPIIGFCGYLIFTIVFSFMMLKNEFIYLMNMAKKLIIKCGVKI